MSRLATLIAAAVIATMIIVAGAKTYDLSVASLSPPQSWPDPEFDWFAYEVEPALDCVAGCYVVDSLIIETDGAVFVRGNIVGGAATSFTLGWPSGSVVANNGAEVFTNGCFWEPNGPPYFSYAGVDRAKSQLVHAGGNPNCDHRAITITWRWAGNQSATPTPAGPSAWQWRETGADTNCGLTQIVGRVLDGDGNPIAGVPIGIRWQDGQTNATTHSGNYPAAGPSGFDFFLNNRPVENWWKLFRIENGQPAEIIAVHTDSSCGDGKRNIIYVELVRSSPAGATPTVILTAAPSATRTPIVAATITPVLTPNPNNPEFYAWLVEVASETREIDLNDGAALLKACSRYGAVPVGNETVGNWEGKLFAIQLFESPTDEGGYISYAPVGAWSNVTCLQYQVP